jgi:serine/threonine-protein kinase
MSEPSSSADRTRAANLAEQLAGLWEQGQGPDVDAFLAQAGPLAPGELAAVLRVDQRQRWQAGERVPAEAYLQRYPALQADPDAAFELVYKEFLLRERGGEQPPVQEYLDRFPQYADELAPQFEVHRAVATDTGFDPSSTGVPPTVQAGPDLSGAATASRWGWPTIPGYEILAELGRGGLGVVYKARDQRLKRMVALKMLLAGGHASPEQLARFRAEAEAVARLQHPHIVQIFEVGEHEGRPYFALEYVEGGSLDRRLAGTPQPARRAAELVETLARAMHYAHEHGLVHRDLKPANILLRRKSEIRNPKSETNSKSESLSPKQGAPEVSVIRISSFGFVSDFGFRISDFDPKITDFGLAKQLDVDVGQTPSGAIMGTPSYMAPEQAAGQARQVGPAADVYALGAILYELLTGRPPFKGETPLETLSQALAAEPLPPRRLQPKLPADLETICLKCLQKQPGKRYASAGDLAEDLRRFLSGAPIRARPTPWPERVAKWARRRPALAALLAVGGGALVTVLAVVLWSNTRLRTERDRAEAHFRAAQAAVDEYLTLVSEERLLREPGLQPLRRQLLEAALRHYQDFLHERQDDPSLRMEVARAWGRVAGITEEIGSKATALEAGEQAVALWEELLRADAGSVPVWRGLAESYERTGNLQGRLGRPAEALRRTEQAFELRSRLAAAEPAKQESQEALAQTHTQIGRWHAALGQLEPARTAFLRAQEQWPPVGTPAPTNPESLIKLARTYSLHGLVAVRLGRVAEAEQLLQQAREHRAAFARANPTSSLVQAELAENWLQLGDVQLLANVNPAAAQAHYEQALALLEKLAHDNPAVVDFQRRLAETYGRLAQTTLQSGRLAESLRHLQQTTALFDKLAQINSEEVDIRFSAARIQYHVNIVRLALGQGPAARAALVRVRQLAEGLVKSNPDNDEYRDLLADACQVLGSLARNDGQLDDAAAAFREGIRHQQAALGRAPECTRYRLGLAGGYEQLTRVLCDLGRPAEAAAAARERRRFAQGDAGELYAVARTLALCIPVVGRGKPALGADEYRQQEAYAEEAVACLGQALAAGFAEVERLRTDPDLEALRNREDFRRLLTAPAKRSDEPPK